MRESEDKMYDLVEDLSVLLDEGFTLIPGKISVNAKELERIVRAFPNAISDEINDAKIILKKKDEILQEAKLRAERIIQDAENERYKLLSIFVASTILIIPVGFSSKIKFLDTISSAVYGERE